MDCDEYLRRLATFLDDDLDEALALELAAHVSDCPPCGEERIDDRLVLRIRYCLDRTETPPDLRRRILERLGRSTSA